MSEEDNRLQIFDSIEKGDLVSLKALLEPPLTVNSIV